MAFYGAPLLLIAGVLAFPGFPLPITPEDQAVAMMQLIVSDLSLHFSIVVSACGESLFERFRESGRITFIQEAPASWVLSGNHRQIVVSCDKDPMTKYGLSLDRSKDACGYGHCDHLQRVNDEFNWNKRILIMLRRVAPRALIRLDENSEWTIPDRRHVEFVIENLMYRAGRHALFFKSFIRIFFLATLENLPLRSEVIPDVRYFFRGTIYESGTSRGLPSLGCTRRFPIEEQRTRRAFAMESRNRSQNLHFGLFGVKIRRGSASTDEYGQECETKDIFVGNCAPKQVSSDHSNQTSIA